MRNAIDLSELQFDWGFDDSEPKAPPISIRHVRTFHQKSEGVITTICPTCDSVAWIACSGDKDVVMYQTDGKEIKRLRLDFYTEDMKLTKLKNLLISASETNFMKLVTTTSGEMTDFVSVHPHKSCGLYITSSRDVLVTAKGGNEGKVIKFSPSGEIIRELVLDRGSVPLYSSPDRVIQNSLCDIIVLDWKLKCVISVDDSWRTKFKYYGHDKNSEMYGNFTPSDIVCDRYDNILVSDCNNNCVHLLDRDGKFLQYLVTEENGLSCPCALALDDTGKLWIGQIDGQIHVLSYYENDS